jgi:hypothetical protein
MGGALEQLHRLEPLRRRISWLRLAAFLSASGAFFAYAWVPHVGFRAAWVVGTVSIAAFVALVAWQRRISRRITTWKNLVAACRQGRARIDRRWPELREIDEPSIDEGSALAADLDILGQGSLYRLTGGAYTVRGRQTLARWLLVPAEAEEVVARQQLVAELRDRTDLLLEMRSLTAELSKTPADPGPFLAWAEGDPWLSSHRGVLWAARLLGPLPILLGVGAALGWIDPVFLILALVVNLLFSKFYAPRVHQIFDAVSARMGRVEPYAVLLRFVSGLQLASPRGRSIQTRLSFEQSPAHLQMKKLERLSSFTDLRLSTALHLPVQMVSLLDFHLLAWIERWQVRVGPRIAGWLETLGEFEAIAGLATLAHDNPSFAFPEVATEGKARFSARGLGHPLLDPATCVRNDVDLGEPGTFLLVTGSNMSGKSSLLRGIGLNAALACAGGAVYADSLSLTPFALGTRFRVVDSVTEGVSFFMAELKRLKQIITWAEERASSGEPPLLFLLDEILQGTNIIERRVAVAAVLKRLVGLGCLGAVSSHDLTLAEAEGLAEHAKPVYFTESFREGKKGREMYFDYKLRPGLAPTTNALELLKLVGLA